MEKTFNSDVHEVHHIDTLIEDDCGMDRDEFNEGYDSFKEMLPRITKEAKERLTPEQYHKFNNIINAMEQCNEEDLYKIINVVGCTIETIGEEEMARMGLLEKTEDSYD